ncbi:unnamed protein product [Effrenium voratum]|nr:unnamed protein product [Effrenium voratum]
MLAMMIIFNSRAAFITSMLASLVLAIWAYCDALPRRQTWTVWPPLVTFYMFLFFWQRIRLLFKPPRMVFLDKLCISQDNDELKAQGIAGLATFLLKSRKMTILWSPRYFSRLWCTYAWLRDPGDLEWYYIFAIVSSIGLPLAFAVCGLFSQIAKQLLQDISQLPKQLGSFSVRDSKCFCCSTDHCHPITGDEILL